MRVDCLKGKEFKNERISNDKRISINKDISIGIHDIPFLHKLDGHIHYTQIGMTIYIIYVNEAEGITYMYMIEQGIEKDALKIENIYTTTIIAEKNTLARFYRYDEEFEKETLTTKLNEIIRAIPVIPEKDYLQRKITEYLEKEEIQVKEVLQYEDLDTPQRIDEKGIQGQKREIVCYGITYETIAEFAKAYGINYSTVATKLWRGMTPEQIIEKTNLKKNSLGKGYGNADPLVCRGIKYRSKAEFARTHGMSPNTVIEKLKMGKTPEEILKEKKNATKGGFREPKKVIYKGVEYPSISEFSRCIGIELTKLNRLLQEKDNVDEAVDNYLLENQTKHHGGRKCVDQDTKYQRDTKYEYEGEMFTIPELAELADIPRKVMWDRIRRSRWTVKKAVETPYEGGNVNE